MFVGRQAEIAALSERIRRAPVSLVWGLGGLGKTALVLHTLHQHFGDRVPRALFLALRPGEPRGQTQVELLRALAEASGVAEIDWSRVLRDSELLLPDVEAYLKTIFSYARETDFGKKAPERS